MFVPHSELDLKKMFDELKINSLDDLFTHIPDALLLENGLDLPESLSELESIDYFDDIAARNKSELVCFAGWRSLRRISSTNSQISNYET